MQCCTTWTVLCVDIHATCFWTMAEGLAAALTSTSSCRMLASCTLCCHTWPS